MLSLSLSGSLYAVKWMNTDSLYTKKVPDYFSFKPQFGYIDLNEKIQDGRNVDSKNAVTSSC